MTTTVDPLHLLGSLVLDSGKRWGEVATDWQLADATAVLTPGPDDPRLHWLGRPKGGSKTTDVAGIAAAWLVAQAGPHDEAYVIASDRDQAARLLNFARGLIARTPGLGDVLDVQSHQIVNRRTGAKVIALAADVAGGEGILSPLVLVDELGQHADTLAARGMWDVALSSVPKVPGMRLVVISHAGIEGSWQHRIYEHALTAPLWRVNDIAGPLPWVDADVLLDQEALLSAGQFARRHMNIWSGAEDALVTIEDLRRCVTLDGPLVPMPGVRYVMGLDIGLTKDRTVACVAHAERLDGTDPGQSGWRDATESEQYAAMNRGEPAPDRVAVTDSSPVRIVLDRMEVWTGSKKAKVPLAEVEAWIVQAHSSFNSAPLVADPYQAVGMAQRLRGVGVEVSEFAFGSASVGRLASTLHRLLRDGALALPDDEELLDELAHVRLIERTPGVVRMDHASGRHDDRAIALALAAMRLLERPPSREMLVSGYENRALHNSR